MIIYLPAILALLIFVAVQFSILDGKQMAAILLVIVSSYFYAVVVASYIELDLANKLLKVSKSNDFYKLISCNSVVSISVSSK